MPKFLILYLHIVTNLLLVAEMSQIMILEMKEQIPNLILPKES